MDDVDDDILVESVNENVGDNMNQLKDEIVERDGSIVPKVGIMFKVENEMFDFYERYAYVIDLSVNDGVLKYLTLTCSRAKEVILQATL